jgi:hypothetical protein
MINPIKKYGGISYKKKGIEVFIAYCDECKLWYTMPMYQSLLKRFDTHTADDIYEKLADIENNTFWQIYKQVRSILIKI